MKTKIYFILLTALALALSSCGEINDPDEPNGSTSDNGTTDNSTTNSSIPDHDGVVQTSGMVDLGLSVKWAARDLDSSTEDHFASSCTLLGSQFYATTKSLDGDLPASIAGTSFDNATSLLGEGWSTPTEDQFMELFNNCRVSYTVYEDAVGLVITGKNNKAIFFKTYWYWTSTSYNSSQMYIYGFTSDESLVSSNSPYYQYSWKYYIRPVYN